MLLVLVIASPPARLTVTPPVYHDEYDLLSPAVALLDGHGLSVPPFSSTPALERAFGGAGRLVPGLNASFHVVLAGWFKVLGAGIWQARLFAYLGGALMVTLVFALGARWCSVWAGSAAALLLVLDGTFWLATRQVRPESFTISAYLLGAWLLSLPSCRWRARTVEVAGVSIGLGVAAHPVGIVMLPVVLLVPFAIDDGTWSRRDLLRLALCIAVIAGLYATFLGSHWDGVRANLQLHRTHRLLVPLGPWEFLVKEWRRYGEGYWNKYSLTIGWPMSRAAFVGWGLLVMAVGFRGYAAGGRAVRSSLVLLAAAPMVVIVVMAMVARDNNFLYLTNFFVWLYLAAAAGVVTGARWVFRLGQRPSWVLVAAWIPLALLAAAGATRYVQEAAPYARRPVLPYEALERLLAETIPRGAFVIAPETAWLATRAAGAQFVFNHQYLQILPPYRRYPVRATFEGGSHLVAYTLDLELLQKLSAAGTQVYYLVDMWDWSWNVYAPFGRYANSFLDLQATLEQFFVPVLRIYTRDRGFVSLYRLGDRRPHERAEPIIYVEGRRHRVGQTVAPRGIEPPTQIRLERSGRIEHVARFDLEPERPYWLRLELAVIEGDAVVPFWDGASLLKSIDAHVSVPLDNLVYPTDDRASLSLLAYPRPAVVTLDRVSLTRLIPER